MRRRAARQVIAGSCAGMGALLKANPSAALVLLEAQCTIFEKHCAIDECQQCAN